MKGGVDREPIMNKPIAIKSKLSGKLKTFDGPANKQLKPSIKNEPVY